jgi:hypothetical protein
MALDKDEHRDFRDRDPARRDGNTWPEVKDPQSAVSLRFRTHERVLRSVPDVASDHFLNGLG